MFNNYLKIAWRNLMRNKVFSIINIAGLSIGISVCILIFLFIQNELSYDQHWNNPERIARINWEESKDGVTDNYGVSCFETGASLKENFPEVESAVRMQQYNNTTVSYQNHYSHEQKHFYVDTNFFDVFNFELAAGNPTTCLKDPNAAVISEAMAKKFFGNSDPIGKVLKYPDKLRKVTGVLKDNSQKSHFKANAFLVFDYASKDILEQKSNWLLIQTYTYIKLKKNVGFESFNSKLKIWSNKYLVPALKKENIEYTIALNCKPVRDIHFDRDHLDGLFDKSEKSQIYIFGWVALFILLIACFNYMNLSTARATKRAKEVSMRKVSGASRRELISQFLGESFFISFIALVFALAILIALVPAFNAATQKEIVLNTAFGSKSLWITAVLLLSFISFVGGSYPALYLSRFQPIRVLKGNLIMAGNTVRTGAIGLRKILVTTQFAISLVIIIATLVVFDQLKLMKNKDLGFNKEQVLVLNLPMFDSINSRTLFAFRNKLLSNPKIKNFSTTNQIIGSAGNLVFEVRSNGKNSQASMNINSGDHNYLDLLNIKLLQGRNFSRELSTDKENFIVNEAAVKFLHLNKPLEAELSLKKPVYGKIIGVIKDYNYKSPHSKIDPLVLVLNDITSPVGTLALVKLSPGNISENIDFISSTWKTHFPSDPIHYSFLDEEFNTQYIREDVMLTLFIFFAALTILISCLGLFGLASFTATQRTKEIGIRKVSGASVKAIVYLISKDFLAMVFIAIIIAFPFAWYFMSSWLQNFAYRAEMNYRVFIGSGVFILIIAFITIAGLALKAAFANPVKSLRTD